MVNMKTACLVFVFIFYSNLLFAQNKENIVITGRPVSLEVPYSLCSDEDLKDSIVSKLLSYPTLIVNDIIISDTGMINCFRNHYKYLKEKRIIYKPQLLSLEQAQKMGLFNVSRDGAIIIKTKKKHYIDLSNCYFY